VLDRISKQVTMLVAKNGPILGVPGLAVIQVGNRSDSSKYVEMKHLAAKKVGIASLNFAFEKDCKTEDIIGTIDKLNQRQDIDGILVQLPLPRDQKRILNTIDPEKDVDGFHPYNIGLLTRMGEELRQENKLFDPTQCRNVACTAMGVMMLLEGTDIAGKSAVILGRSNIVGLPLALMLLHRDATVTFCHSHTVDIKERCLQADILVAAMGQAEMVKGDWIKPGAVVIDVGINVQNEILVGDVDFKQAVKRAARITPVPGGVGPMTVAMLMLNTLNNRIHRLAHLKI